MSQPDNRKKRSVTLIKDKSTQSRHIEFDQYGQPVGPNQSKFSSYAGVTTRTMISILEPSWKKVPRAEIDQLWLIIKEHWNIEDDQYKTQVLKICNHAWKSFKKRLIHKFLRTGEDPVPVYPYLDEFVELKSTEEFQEISQKGRESSLKNTNPPRLGPRGYRGMINEWDKERESGSSSDIHQINNERTRNYLLARRKQVAPGVYTLPHELRPLADELIDRDTQLSLGDWVPEPGVDPLIEVIGSEHSGRTRAVGHIVGLKQAITGIKEKKRRSHEKEYIDEIVAR